MLLSDDFGLLLNDRVHNIPHAIAPHIHEATSQEIISAQQEGNQLFSLSNILYITSYGIPEKRDTPKKKKTKGEDRIYWKAEDTIFEKNASLSFSLPISATETKLFLVFPASSYPTIVTQIQQLIEDGYSW